MTLWPAVRLSALADFKNGLNFAGTSWGRGMKIVGVSDFRDRVFPDYNSLDEIDPRGVVRDVDLLAENDILFVRSNGNRQLIGRCMWIRDLPEPISHSGFTIRLRFKTGIEVHVPFYFYLFRSALIQQVLSEHGGGTNINNLNQGILERLQVPKPPIEDQKKIAAILTAYDDLIANNQRRIALLESMAEEIYREWFVRMRFPGKTANAPESIEPAGWHRKALGELTCLLKRGVSPNYDEKATAVVVNQKCIRNGRLDLADARLHDTPTPDEKLLRYGDVLINSTGVGTLGRAAVFDLDRENITCDSHVTIARPRDVEGEGEFLAFTVQLLQSYFEAMASGSTGQAELGRDFIAKTKVLVPPHELIRAFGERVRPMRKQRRLLMDANEQLVGMRDALLPRLISGKLRVDQLDIQFPPSMRAETAEAAQ